MRNALAKTVQRLVTHSLASDLVAMNVELASGWRVASIVVIPDGPERQATAVVLEKDMDDDEHAAYLADLISERKRMQSYVTGKAKG